MGLDGTQCPQYDSISLILCSYSNYREQGIWLFHSSHTLDWHLQLSIQYHPKIPFWVCYHQRRSCQCILKSTGHNTGTCKIPLLTPLHWKKFPFIPTLSFLVFSQFSIYKSTCSLIPWLWSFLWWETFIESFSIIQTSNVCWLMFMYLLTLSKTSKILDHSRWAAMLVWRLKLLKRCH